jgi:hypothetical protein
VAVGKYTAAGGRIKTVLRESKKNLSKKAKSTRINSEQNNIKNGYIVLTIQGKVSTFAAR